MSVKLLLAAAMMSGMASASADMGASATVETNETQSASFSAEEMARLARKVEAWFGSRRWYLRKSVANDGRGFEFRGVMGRFSTFLSQIPFTVHLNEEGNNKIAFFAFLPISVPKDRMDAVSELLLLAARKFGLSSVDMTFDADEGVVRLQSAFSVVSLRDEPEAVLDDLVIPVAEYVASCSDAVARRSLGTESAEDALAGMEKLSLDMLRTKGAKVVGDAEAAEMLKRHLNGVVSHYEVVEMDGLTQFKITLNELDGPYESLDTCLAVKDGVVISQCFLPTNVSPWRIAEVRRYVMRRNYGSCFCLCTLDPESGRVGLKYADTVRLLSMSTDDKAVGRECFLLLCYTAYKLNELAKELPKEFEADKECVMLALDQAEEKINSIVKTRAYGGRPLPPSDEPLPCRYARTRRSFVDRKLGFSDRKYPAFPTLAPVKNASGLKLGLAERFAESVKGNVAQFPDGEIRWTEDGTNGLSLVESDAKILKAQIKCVRDAMKGLECANEAGTVWILNDDFLFGYSLELDKKRKDELKFVLMPRRKLGDAPDNVAVVIEFIPSQLVLDSIVGSFYGDKTACANVRLLRAAELVSLVAE